jgi:formylglycine-generating enzyme required for sulfatase activity
MVVLPAGSFNMGSPSYRETMPQHQVTIEAPFAVAKYELTFAEWDACESVGACPQADDSGMGRGNRPVINVSWNDAQQYVAWLSQMTGKSYRLLSEAEYEYAARGGTLTAYYWGDQIGVNNANCAQCGSLLWKKQTAPVGQFAPNAFGLYDMAGNVWEWVEDCYNNSYNGAPTDGSGWKTGNCDRHVLRGGGWQAPAQTLRSDFRYYGTKSDRWDDRGFRVARTIKPQ